MRAMILGAALVAMVAAAPGRQKRDVNVVVETVTDIVYVVETVTVTATDAPVYTSSIAVSPSSASISIPSIAVSPSSASVSIPSIASSSINYAPTPINHIVNSPVESDIPIVATPSSVLGYSVVTSPTSIAAPPYSTSTIQTSASIIPSTSVIPVVSTPVSIRPPPSISVSSSPVSVAPPPASTSAPVSVAPPPASTSTPATGGGIPVPTDYASTVVAHHNLHRRNHSAIDIVWDTALAATADSIAHNCVYAHNTTADRDRIGGYGQNIAAGIGSDNVSVIITELFYNGEVGWYQNLYGQAQPDMTNFEHWGHFSQIVWGSTTKVGCATYHCEHGLANVAANVPPYMTVCNYQAPGNIANDYTEVGYSLGLPTADWDYFA